MRQLLRSAEIALWSVGLLCASALVFDRMEAATAQKTAVAVVSAPAAIPSSNTERNVPIQEKDGVLGRLEIPALHLSTAIVDDSDTRSLLRGAGHIRGTALPGGLGNFVVAAHRDTFFRPLSGIKPGMRIRVITPDDTYVYVVDATQIVNPQDVDVLDMGDVPQMTLITCYPFHYIGAAPQRFTVRAHLLSF